LESAGLGRSAGLIPRRWKQYLSSLVTGASIGRPGGT